MSKGKENVVKSKDAGIDDNNEEIHISAVPHMHITGRINKNSPEESLKEAPFKVNAQNSLAIAQEIFTEIGKVGTLISKEWNNYLNLLSANNENLLDTLIKDHDIQLKKDFNKFILRNYSKKPSVADIDRMRLEYTKKFRPSVNVLL